ncbi:hypothetical protein HN51_022859 [Arachis hypogaea]|uniref:BHLH domain-containing protein n=2 Tax=Arachis TaxID=3817 RepID=A0A445EA66_ARAHY|nr:transcription factor bHLH140 [Arachis duranensis]QHO54202.1 Transcription factor [Arachis hypogaea]RYR72414.1 hypothetical protein Ahy_A02g006634 [Arachis hypogaea]
MDCIDPSGNTITCASIEEQGSSSNPNNKRKKGNAMNNNKKKNKGVMKLSTDPQSVAARERRHRISDRFKILQSMVPGGSKMDTVSMLEEAIHYVKFLKAQIWLHQTLMMNYDHVDNNNNNNNNNDNSINDQCYYYCYPADQDIVVPLHQQQNVSPSVFETLPELPLSQCCIQGDEATTNIDASVLKNWWPPY